MRPSWHFFLEIWGKNIFFKTDFSSGYKILSVVLCLGPVILQSGTSGKKRVIYNWDARVFHCICFCIKKYILMYFNIQLFSVEEQFASLALLAYMWLGL